MVDVEEEILAKTGPALFKELLRVYPVAEVDDYFKAGQWNNNQIKVDLQLIHVHRREAGAPDPPALEDVKMPEMPQATAFAGGIQLPGTAVRPPGTVAAPAIRPVVAAKAGVAVPATVSPGAAGAGAVSELRLIALFVTKWKLDPTRTKMMLAKLLPARRRYVIQHFKCTTQGAEATTALEQFIAKCEQTNAWANASAVLATAGGPRPVAPMAVAGVKRPLTQMPQAAAAAAAKRPKMVAAIAPKAVAKPAVAKPGLAKPGGIMRPLAGLRPAGPMTVRPPGVRPAVVAPKAPGQPGSLIKGLLQRF